MGFAMLDGDGSAKRHGRHRAGLPGDHGPGKEAGLGAPKEPLRKVDPLIVLTAAAAVKLGLPEHVQGHEQRRCPRLSEEHAVVEQVIEDQVAVRVRPVGAH